MTFCVTCPFRQDAAVVQYLCCNTGQDCMASAVTWFSLLLSGAGQPQFPLELAKASGFQHLSNGISNLTGLDLKVLSILNALVNTLIFIMALRDEQLSSPFYKWEIRRTGICPSQGHRAREENWGESAISCLTHSAAPPRHPGLSQKGDEHLTRHEPQFQMNTMLRVWQQWFIWIFVPRLSHRHLIVSLSPES